MAAAILGLGNPLLDISVEVKDLALVERYGLKMGNAILAAAEHAPLYAELVDTFGAPGGSGVQYIAGGATQNSVRVAQWVSGEPAGFAAYVGCVGDDAFGKTLAAAAAADGVTALYQVTADKPTGTCAVIVHEQERSLVANLAAAEALAEAHLDSEAVAAAVASAKVVYCAGFPLTHAGGAASVQRLGKACADGNKVFATNLSAPFIVQVRTARLDAAASAVRATGRPRGNAPPHPPALFARARLCKRNALSPCLRPSCPRLRWE
jgi:adenosine kinase